jgi:AcrR family transcriptional regulator
MPRASAGALRSRRARPTDAPRERLLAAADDLFYRRGVRNVGIDEVIAAAGVAKASLYHHFASKDELIAEYVQRRGDDWWTWFRGTVEAQASTPAARLIAVFDVLKTWLDDRSFEGCALQNTCVQLSDPSHAAHRAAVTGKRGVRAYLTDLARQAGRRAPEQLADQLALLFEGAVITARLEGTSAPAVAARRAAAVLLRES